MELQIRTLGGIDLVRQKDEVRKTLGLADCLRKNEYRQQKAWTTTR